MSELKDKVPVMENKKRVQINVTKHIKTFINERGEEISREEAFDKKPKTNN